MSLGKRSRRLGFIGEGRSTPVFWDRWDSLAFQGLKASHKLVLIDMDRIYVQFSGWDTRSIMDRGFRYAFGNCSAGISESTFYDAMKQIVAREFYVRAPEYEWGPSPASVYLPSNGWRNFTPASDEVKQRTKRATLKLDRASKQKFRKSRFLAKKDPEKSGREESDNHGEEDVSDSDFYGEVRG